MKSVNRVTLLGNITRDAELKATTNGQSVCTFGLATNRVWKDPSGQKQSLPEYHNLVAWGALAEFCGQYIKKGKPVFVEGYLKTRSWESPEGNKVYRTEIVAENIVLLGAKDDGGHESFQEPSEMTPQTDFAAGGDIPMEGAGEIPMSV